MSYSELDCKYNNKNPNNHKLSDNKTVKVSGYADYKEDKRHGKSTKKSHKAG